MFYQKPFYITEPLSNNAFDFAARQQINPHPQIYVPSLIEGDLADLKIGQQIVFEAQDDNGNLQSCRGLQNFLKTKFAGIDTYIFDNHHHAFFFWHWHFLNQQIPFPTTLIHLDQHKDTRLPAVLPDINLSSPQALEELYQYTHTWLNVGNFIPAAISTGLIQEVIQINSSEHLENFALQETPSNFILDLDLDFLAPELNYLPAEKIRQLFQELAPKSQLITIATSPFFIDQNLALQKLRQLTADL